MKPLYQDIVELEEAIKTLKEKARLVHHRMMREFPDGEAKPFLGLMELAIRSIAQANDAARYSRHALSTEPPPNQTQGGHNGY